MSAGIAAALGHPTHTDLPSFSLFSPLLWARYFGRRLGSLVPPSPVKSFVYGLTGLSVARDVFIGEGAYFVDGFKGGLIKLCDEAVISPHAVLVAMAVPGSSFLGREFKVTKTGKITIGEGAWIGAGAVVLPGVVVGRGAIVGANAVVSKSVPPFDVVGGNPARRLKSVHDFERRKPTP